MMLQAKQQAITERQQAVDDNALHRHYYYQQPVDVIKELQEQEESRQPGIFDILGLGAYAGHMIKQEIYDNFRFRVAIPRKLED